MCRVRTCVSGWCRLFVCIWQVLDSIGSEQHNKNKIEMVNEHYGNMPGWLQVLFFVCVCVCF